MAKPRGFFRKTKVRGYTINRDLRKLPKRTKSGTFKAKRKRAKAPRIGKQITLF